MSNEEGDTLPLPTPYQWSLGVGEMSTEEDPTHKTHPPHHKGYQGMEQLSDVHLDKLGQGVNIIFVC